MAKTTTSAKLLQVPATGLTACASPEEAVEAMILIHEASVADLAADFERFSTDQNPKGVRAVYPYLCVNVIDDDTPPSATLAFGKVAQPGLQGSSIAAPRLFRAYLIEQLQILMQNYETELYVGKSLTPIPLPFAVERASTQLDANRRRQLAKIFHMPDLAATHDTLVDGAALRAPIGSPQPLSLFSAERVDYSLHRLRHYTGTSPAHFQPFVLFTNYQRYVDEFIEWGLEEVRAERAELLVEPGDRSTGPDGVASRPPLAKAPQMPAYHLVQKDGMGVTLVNIGVGPSNAKTITDHIAVLRPHVWLMVGHCGGLRASQILGDYVLAHAYLRDDGVLDRALPLEIPLPTIAEVQLALANAITEVTGLDGRALKQRLRTGTVVTTHDRNWELRFDELAIRFNQSRAIGIDMESATIAANGYRFRVPYGTLLCVSDRPLHGEIKLPAMADAFYEESVSQHLQIGLRALGLLREEARAGTLHSRKLRSFTEPAFR